MSNILQHTPLLAYLVLALVVLRGIAARGDRVVSVGKAVTLPLIMLLWSLWRMLAMPHHVVQVTLPCLAAAALAVYGCRRLGYPRGLLLDATAESIHVPGSWLTPILMLAVYFAHFASAVIRAKHPALAAAPVTLAAFALVYGGISGIFFARTVAIWQLVAARKSVRGRNEFAQ